jgi:hypothetical protein
MTNRYLIKVRKMFSEKNSHSINMRMSLEFL